jgi:aspartate racemase
MSWESSLEYYRIINETVKHKLGGFHSAKSLMYSVDFQEIEQLQHQGDWEQATRMMIDAAQRVERGGADFLVICTNTMHLMAKDVERSIQIPLLHIADVTAAKIKEMSHSTVGLLGTRFTMEQDFYKGRLKNDHGIEVIIPDEKERSAIHTILYDELCMGDIKPQSRDKFKKIISNLEERGAEGIILGCTEIPLIVKQENYEIFLYDTTTLHAEAAVNFALQ